MSELHTWLILPRDPLVVRDGRPFSADPGARARSLPFPLPSTLAGVVRALAGSDAEGVFRHPARLVSDPNGPQGARKLEKPAELEALENLAIRGPLLVEQGDPPRLMLPAPADALAYADGLHRLEPIPAQGECNLPRGLRLVGLREPTPATRGKPVRLPRFWYWPHYLRWLEAGDATANPARLGHDGPVPEVRTHVKIAPDTQTAEEGFLFQTGGLEFARAGRLGQTPRLALLVQTEATGGGLAEGFRPVAGERRLALWAKGDPSLLPAACPEGIKRRIIASGRCRLVLQTPAILEGGLLPDGGTTWNKLSLLESDGTAIDVEVKIEAVANPRHQVVSGWDMAFAGLRKDGTTYFGQPKPTRRMVPAGSVYWLSLTGEPEAIEAWVDAVWLNNVSDADADEHSGFGLALLGVWEGEP